jgi:transposase
MTAEERIAELEQENRELRAQLAEANQQIAQLLDRLQQVEGTLAKNSRNSSKAPSSDGPGRKTHSQRTPSGKKAGGQLGHQGRTLMQVVTPDEVVCHRPVSCTQCQQPLAGITGCVKERRQIYDLPEVRLVVQEHQVEEVCCPTCQHPNEGSFPSGVEAAAQYGPKVRALAVYLHQYQLVPLARTCELLEDLYESRVSEGTLLAWVEQAAIALEPTMQQLGSFLTASRLQHADETGIRVKGQLHWVHVNSTRWWTHLAWHARRGKQALEAIGIWPRFHGRAVRDRWASYDCYACAHSICGAHLLRDCTYVQEQEQQEWAGQMHDLLVSMAKAAEEWRQQGAVAVPAYERDEWVAQYFDLLVSGFVAQPTPSAEEVPKRRGRHKQSAAKNLLDDLLHRADQVLAFLDDLSIPFTNNQAERDLRMVKVQQKIAGTFRSEAGATAFCHIRSYLSTMRKQGHPMLAALAAVFAGKPLAVAWGF